MLPNTGERLRFLMDHIYPATAKPYSQAQLAELISTADNPVSQQQIHGLLSGRTKNPSFKLISQISSFFGVPLEFFDTDDEEVWERYTWWITHLRQQADMTDLQAARANRFREIRRQKWRKRPSS